MKKILLAFAAGAFVYSCDLPQGGNKGVIKMSEDQVRYSDANAEKGTYVAPAENTTADSAKTPATQAIVTDSAAAPVQTN